MPWYLRVPSFTASMNSSLLWTVPVMWTSLMSSASRFSRPAASPLTMASHMRTTASSIPGSMPRSRHPLAQSDTAFLEDCARLPDTAMDPASFAPLHAFARSRSEDPSPLPSCVITAKTLFPLQSSPSANVDTAIG